MPEEVVMPKLSDTMTEGTISKWLKRPGDQVQKGEPLVEVETDKANMELESYASGTLASIILDDGQSAPVGEPIGIIALPGESTSPSPAAGAPSPAAAGEGRVRAPADSTVTQAPSPSATHTTPSAGSPPATPAREVAATSAEAAAQKPSPESPGAVTTVPGPEPDRGGALTLPSPAAAGEGDRGAHHRLRASPLAPRLARERGLDLSAIAGSGPLGRIQKDDVEAAAVAAPSGAGAEVEEVALSRMQQTIARRMVEAKQVPHFYVSVEVEMNRAVDVLAELNEGLDRPEQVTINDLILRASAVTLRDYPDVNSFYQDGKLLRNRRVHVGFAVAFPGGLVEPVVRDADQKGVRQIAREAKALARKVRDGKIEPRDFEGGTFSISNLGMFGVEDFAAIINPPHSAILAVGAVADKAVALDGQLAIRKRCTLTLSADHRVFYGATAAEFLRALKQHLEKPLTLLG